MNTARELTKRLADLLRNERAAMADFLVQLADFDGRKLWRDLGHTSLFSFLRRELGLSAGAAQYRKTAAELLQRYPQVEAALRDGRLCLSSVIELAKVITPENAAEVVPRFFGLSSRDAAQVAVSIRPVEEPPQRDAITPLRPAAAELPAVVDTPPIPPAVTVCDSDSAVSGARNAERCEHPAPELPARALPRSASEPLTAETSRLHVTVSRRFLEKLEAATAALSHAHPGAGMEEILEAGLDLVIAEHAKRKGLVAKPRKEPASPGRSPSPRPSPPAGEREAGKNARCIPPSPPAGEKEAGKNARYIPAHVKRAVWIRDRGRCQFRMEDGSVCGSTFQLEFDHVRPRALGGLSTIENVRLACRPHNGLAARRVFGDPWMDRFTRSLR